LVDDEQPDDDAPPVAEIESILGKCDAQGIPQRMLEWHYRSRHPSLIAVSNKHFYNSRLFIVPNAHPDNPELGLRFHHLPDAVYDRGGSRMNAIEAKAVAQAVMRHARKHADLSLGVGCFSVAQRDAILHELEVARRLNKESESFFASHSEEPFFVKNLENIQGDERDVILISVGYGRDASGYMAMSFGPLNADGGERRLNVLITRAKQRCQVLSSITADDIDLSRAPNPGVAALKAFLKYAETGIVDVPRPTGREADSVFEEQVASALEGLGHKVDAQVGTAGFFIDLAIRDPSRPGRYLLGVECDGATYHSARSARDRDRLRQQVLEDRDWFIHRIWSTDWFRQPQKELRRLVEAIEAAKIEWSIRDRQTGETKPTQTSNRTIERQQAERLDLPDTTPMTTPYVEAHFTVPGNPEPHLLSRERMLEIVGRIVEIEGPIHRDEIARRVTGVCGYTRTGRRIVDAVVAGLRSAERRGLVARDGDFFQSVAGNGPTIRDRSNVLSQSLRKPEMLPPAEIREAAVQLIRGHFGVSAEEVVIQVSRLLGFQSTSAQLRALIQAELDRLILEGLLERKASGGLGLRNAA
jgi:very-short-patch-repair endonuclease